MLAGGGGDDRNNNNNNDGGNNGGDGWGEAENAGDKNREEALIVLAGAGRVLESLPKDLKSAIEAGRVPGAVVEKFLELEKFGVLRWLMQFGGFKERLLADDLFLAKVFMECGVGIFTKVDCHDSEVCFLSCVFVCLFVLGLSPKLGPYSRVGVRIMVKAIKFRA